MVGERKETFILGLPNNRLPHTLLIISQCNSESIKKGLVHVLKSCCIDNLHGVEEQHALAQIPIRVSRARAPTEFV
jgi:hypothetical protein